MLDAKTSLGGSLGMACGLAKMQTDREVVAIVGDSAFFHSEIPTFVYAGQNQAEVIAMIVYNHAAGVTGRQPNPASGFDMKRRKGGHHRNRRHRESLQGITGQDGQGQGRQGALGSL